LIQTLRGWVEQPISASLLEAVALPLQNFTEKEMKNNKVAVIGGSGKSGRYLVKRLLENRSRIKLLTRNPGNLPVAYSSLEVLKGDARNYESILELVSDCGSIISTLGQPRGEPSIFSQSSGNIIRAMMETGIHRYIVTTGLSVNTPFDEKSPETQFATDWMYRNFPETTRDKQIEYELLSKSKVGWTLIRLPLIIQTDDRFPLRVNLKDCPGDKISSTDLAGFIINQLSDTTYLAKSPFLANV